MRNPGDNTDQDQAAFSIRRINPKIESVLIEAVPTFHAKRGDLSVHTKYVPSDNCRLIIKCPNIDCDCHYIDLSNEVFEAVKQEKEIKGRKRCSGHLKKYNHNRSSSFDCEAYVDYIIKPTVKDK